MPRDEQRICAWCSREYTAIRSGPGRPPIYCGEECRRAAARALNAGWMRRKRWRDTGHSGPAPVNPVGRPRKG
jgi:hypothetical protein